MSRDLTTLWLTGTCAAAALVALAPGARAQGDAGGASSADPPAPRAAYSAPVPGGSATPKAWLPPGAPFPDQGPSKVIFPPQQIPLRFSHKKHMEKDGLGLKCVECHGAATTSVTASDRLLPAPKVCDGCHGSDHGDLLAVKGGDEGFGSCEVCHAGYKASDGNRVTVLAMPPARLRSNHKIHADRNIGCESCHGAVQEIELATREQLPRMKGCFGCHAMSGPGQGKARNDCNTCHEPLPDGRMISSYPDGKLFPPRWMGNLEHTADYIDRHKRVAADNTRACGSCHNEHFCTDCHDGRVRPRSVHPNDYLSLHPVEARLDNPRCTSCHQEQQFCQPCHTRAGVTMTASPENVRNQGRFHPPRAIWSELPRTRQHHAWEAMRNLNACVACHTERDCTICHASQAAGGRGFNPHPPGFSARCRSAASKNPRPCLVCHEGTHPRDLCP
ncbi:MAG: cytochrome c3 family protein [Myxococcales bacterium]|nr:cytochrome c3 family protein [Polyangiaceae bacterium]MDW8251303.1 cytochrome c3 family protein [Myxococcales bacterium]